MTETVTVGADVTYYITLDLETGKGSISEPFYRDKDFNLERNNPY